MHEIETKILGVDVKEIKSKLLSLGAKEIQNTRLVVDWYGPKGLTHDGDDPWYLRVRSYGESKIEVTWKGKSDILGVSRKHKEINFTVLDSTQVSSLFEELGLVKYMLIKKKIVSLGC
jgi:adenylate cyclase class IV